MVLALSFLTGRRIGHPAEQPVEADIECVSDIAKPVERQMDRRHSKIAPGIRRKARTLGDLLRRHTPCFARLCKPGRK